MAGTFLHHVAPQGSFPLTGALPAMPGVGMAGIDVEKGVAAWFRENVLLTYIRFLRPSFSECVFHTCFAALPQLELRCSPVPAGLSGTARCLLPR